VIEKVGGWGGTWRVKRKRAHHLVRTSGMLKEAMKLLRTDSERDKGES
jgi:hypothetical protein